MPSALSPYDKVIHFSMYGVFAAMLAHQAMPEMGTWRGMFIALVLGSAFGAADEWHQGFIPGRSKDMKDWQADTAGAIAGALVAVGYRRARTPRS